MMARIAKECVSEDYKSDCEYVFIFHGDVFVVPTKMYQHVILGESEKISHLLIFPHMSDLP